MIPYALVSVLLFPVTLAGYVIWVCGALLGGRGSGVSGTAQGPLSARFFADTLGTRRDEPARRLMLALPNVPSLGLHLFAWPMQTASRLTGHVPRVFKYPYEGEVVPQVPGGGPHDVLRHRRRALPAVGRAVRHPRGRLRHAGVPDSR